MAMIKIDLKVGDTILTGKWKNKKVVVKSIGEDEFGSPTVNGKSILKIRIPKFYQKEGASMKMKDLIKEGTKEAYYKMADWMPGDRETQLEWIKILQTKNVKEIERFIDHQADYKILKRYLGSNKVSDLARYIVRVHSKGWEGNYTGPDHHL